MSVALTWDNHKYLQSYVKAAISFGNPPIAHILEDPSHTEWTRMDYRVSNAYQMMLDFETEGWPIWIDQSNRVRFEAKTRVSRSAEALERKQWHDQKAAEKQKNHVPKFGQRYYATPVTIDGGPMPTKQEWLESQREKAEAGMKRLTSGQVVKTAANPEMMAEYRARKVPKRASQQ